MTTSALAFIIFSVLALQVSIALLVWYVHRKRELKNFHLSLDTPSNISSNTTNTSKQTNAAWTGFKAFIVQRKQLEDKNKLACSFYLIPADGQPLPRFLPGQFINVKLQIKDPNNHTTKNVIRGYSLSNSVQRDHYQIIVKRVRPSGLASNYLHDHIQEGEQILIKAPTGQFYLQENVNLPIVLIAGGIGITPLLSMLKTLLDQNSPREIWLFYGVPNGNEHIMKSELNTLAQQHKNVHLHVCYDQPNKQDQQGKDYHHKGYIDLNLLRLTLPAQKQQFYICGPTVMMDNLIPALQTWGINSDDIFYESFGSASPSLSAKKQSKTDDSTLNSPKKITVYFKQSDQKITWNPKTHSLLELAEEHDIEVDSGCRSGSCGVCQVKLESGDVEYTQPPDIDIEAGHCLLCIAQPKNDITLIA